MATTILAGRKWAFEDPDGVADTFLTIKGIESAPDLFEEQNEITVTAIDDLVEKTRPGLDTPSELELVMQDFSATGDLDADQEILFALAVSKREDVKIKAEGSNGRIGTFTADLYKPGIPGGAAGDLNKLRIALKRTSPITWASPAAV